MNDAWWSEVKARFAMPANGWPSCDAGHTRHERCDTLVFPPGSPIGTTMRVFDAPAYKDTHGYCPGDDDVSRTLIVAEQWEPVESKMFCEVLRNTPGAVLDIGAHIGWYSMIAALDGRDVFAFEAVSEHIDLWHVNTSGLPSNARIAQAWIDGSVPILPVEGAPDIAIAKIDLEGNDGWAIAMLSKLIDAGNVANILMEVSPTFNDRYPALIRSLMHLGYTAETCNPHIEFGMTAIDAICMEFPQVDMMFRRAA